MSRRTFAGVQIVLVAGWVFLLGSCGIPQIIVLAPPELVSVPSLTNVITIAHSTDNDFEDFLGYELFYKFYDPATGESDYSSDRTALEGASPGSALSQLAQRGYLRVHASPGTSQVPAIEVTETQRAQEFQIDLSFPASPIATDPANALSTSTPVIDQNLIRDRSVLTSETEGFTADAIDLTDNDIPDVDPVPTDDRIDMGVVIISYGVDFTNGTFARVTSQPLVLPDLLEIYFE